LAMPPYIVPALWLVQVAPGRGAPTRGDLH